MIKPYINRLKASLTDPFIERSIFPIQKLELTTVKKILFLILASAAVQSADIYETYPGTNVRDYSKPGYHVDQNSGYPTLPGTNGARDYSRPGYGVQRDSGGETFYPTLSGTNGARDWSQPGVRIQEK
jgi:hypothetical protein